MNKSLQKIHKSYNKLALRALEEKILISMSFLSLSTHKKIQREVKKENLDLSSNEIPLGVYNFLPNPRISFKNTQPLTIKCHKIPLL